MSVHFTTPIVTERQDDSRGEQADKIFITDSKKKLQLFIENTDIGDYIDIQYNKYGKVDTILSCD